MLIVVGMVCCWFQFVAIYPRHSYRLWRPYGCCFVKQNQTHFLKDEKHNKRKNVQKGYRSSTTQRDLAVNAFQILEFEHNLKCAKAVWIWEGRGADLAEV